MDKKKTILIAVMINGGLLLLLFIAALTTQKEETAPLPYVPLAESHAPNLEKEGGAIADLGLAKTAAPEPISSLVVEEPLPLVQHKLPPLAQEIVPEVLPPAPQERSAAEVVVKKGDSLEKIARIHHTSVDALIRSNHLSSTALKVGQVLKLPEERSAAPKLKPPAPQEKTGGAEYYTVKVGDNPWTIAMKHNLKVDQLLKLNGLNEEKARKLKPGDRLRIR